MAVEDVLGRVLGKFGALKSVLARVPLGGVSLARKKEQRPRQHSLQHPEFCQHSSQHILPSHFLGFPFLYSVAGRPGRNSR